MSPPSLFGRKKQIPFWNLLGRKLYEMLIAALQNKYPNYKMYAMRLAEDYLDFSEEYLVSVDAIEWE